MSEDENHDRAKWGRLFHSIRCAHSVPQTSPFQEPDSTLNNPIQRLDNPDHLKRLVATSSSCPRPITNPSEARGRNPNAEF